MNHVSDALRPGFPRGAGLALPLGLGLVLAASAPATLPAAASDWPNWLGPGGSNLSMDASFQPDLAQYKTAWEARIGKGYASVTVAQGKAIVSGHDGTSAETVFCFDAATGKELWKHSYPAELLPRMHTGGPNASATVVGDRVLALSKDGQLHCLSIQNGSKLWEAALPAALGTAVPQWGFGSSAAVHGSSVLVSAGKVIQLDLATGKTLWVSKESYPAAYATPVAFDRDGQTYIAAMNGKGLSILSGKDGTEIAHRPLKAQFDLLAPTPIVLDQGKRVFISGNASSEMLTFDGKALAVAWESKDLRNALNNSVAAQGTLYGIDGRQGTPTCRLVAVNAADGKVLWTKDAFGYGTTIGVRDTLLALTESGELVSARLATDGYHELGRTQVLGKTCWTSPTVAQGRIYVRNDQGHLICLASR